MSARHGMPLTHLRSWEKERTRFKEEILPAIAGFSIHEIAKVTGLSLRYASLIRSEYIPHPVHNQKLLDLISL